VVKHNLGKWSSLLLTALGFLLVLGGVALALWMLAANADRDTRLREQQQVAHGIAGWIEETEARIAGQTNWDDALNNLGVAYDAEWAHTNVGQFLHDMGGLEQAFVLDAADQPVYGMVDGQDVAPQSFAAMARAAAPLIAEVRRGEAQRPALVGKPPFAVMLSKPIQASLVSRVGNQPAVISATLVQPDFGTVSLAGRAPIVITVEALNQEFLTKFGNRFLLSQIALRDLAEPVGDHEAAYELTSSDGAGVARLSWRQQSPGMHLLGQAMPPVLGVLALLLAGTKLTKASLATTGSASGQG
jgi:sensor domain CHASE-containing protein